MNDEIPADWIVREYGKPDVGVVGLVYTNGKPSYWRAFSIPDRDVIGRFPTAADAIAALEGKR